MKNIFAVVGVLLLALTGCVTMPEAVPEAYLADKTNDEGKMLDKLSGVIIEKNHEIKGTRDKVRESKHSLEVEQGRLVILQDEKKLLTEKQKQYELEKDQAKIDENRKMIIEKENEIAYQNIKVEYAGALYENDIAKNEVAESELAVFVAELNYERSKIAKIYLLKRQAAGGEDAKKDKKEKADMYEEKYQKYLDAQREILTTKKNEREKTAVKLKIAEEKLKK